MSKKILAISLISALSLTGCAGLTNEDSGVIAGGIAGGLLGSQFGGGSGQVLAAGAGALLGAYLGGKIGKSMDKTDRLEMQRALETSKTGQTVRWRNPDNGNRYAVKPTKTYYNHHQACRKFTTSAVISGKHEIIHGKACRDSKGRWKME